MIELAITTTPDARAFLRAWDAEAHAREEQALRMDQWFLAPQKPWTRRKARLHRVWANRERRRSRQTWCRWYDPSEPTYRAMIFCDAPGWNGRFTIDPAPAPVEPERPRYVRHYVEGEG